MLLHTLNFFLVASALLFLGCAQEGNKNSKADLAMANPASTKCIDDGYQLLEQLSANKVSLEFICYNKSNGRKCDQWAYYRGTCALK